VQQNMGNLYEPTIVVHDISGVTLVNTEYRAGSPWVVSSGDCNWQLLMKRGTIYIYNHGGQGDCIF